MQKKKTYLYDIYLWNSDCTKHELVVTIRSLCNDYYMLHMLVLVTSILESERRRKNVIQNMGLVEHVPPCCSFIDLPRQTNAFCCFFTNFA